jgi:hypothetical protein
MPFSDEFPAPAVKNKLPPRLPAALELPECIIMLPPIPLDELPPNSDTSPPAPIAAAPLCKYVSPEVPSNEMPVVKEMSPLLPSLPASAVAKDNSPLLYRVLLPELITKLPPVPQDLIISPLSPSPLPAAIETFPPAIDF